MMYHVSEENYREEHGEEGFNLLTYGAEDKVYLDAIFLLTLSPGVDLEILKGFEE